MVKQSALACASVEVQSVLREVKTAVTSHVFFSMPHRTFTEERPEDLVYLPEFLSEDESAAVSDLLAAHTHWSPLGKKRRLPFGYLYGLGRRKVIGAAPPFPPLFVRFAERICQVGLMDDLANQATVQEYQRAQGIGHHIDAPDFGPDIVSVSLYSPCVMRFTRADRVYFQQLAPLSALGIRGTARSEWEHEIRGSSVPGLRVSITFRTVVAPAALHGKCSA
jgi:alkylated DNA repair protein (DNA oxidative demethylase)